MTSEGEKMVGVRMTKSGEFSAEKKNPIRKRSWVWLGVFGTAEEATRAYLSAEERVDSAASENPPLQNSVPTKFVGVGMSKSGKFWASIRDPFKKKKVWLGSFTTREEASMAYLAKKAQFDVKKRRIDRVADSTSFQQGARIKISGVRRTRRGKYSAEIKDPTTKRRVWIGTFATQEEATRAYLAKEADFERVASVYSSNETGRCGAEYVGENKVSGEEEEAGFGVFHGVQVVDENGFLVGEFSVVDDLRICSEEEDANS